MDRAEGEGQRPDDRARDEQGSLSIWDHAGSDQYDAKPVQAVEQQSEHEQHVQAEEHGGGRDSKEGAPGMLPCQQHRQHAEV